MFNLCKKWFKGIKNKNIKVLNGKPLIQWTFDVAKKIKEFNKIILSSDSKKIINLAEKNKIDVPFLRPKNLAKDNSKELNVWKHALKYLKKINQFPDILVVLPPTSPLRKSHHILYAIKKFLKEKPDALITVKDPENNPYFNMIEIKKNNFVKIVNDKVRYFTRQDAPKVYSMSTICFVLKPEFVLNCRNIFDGKVSAAIFERKYSIDIDDKHDFDLAKFLLNKKK